MGKVLIQFSHVRNSTILYKGGGSRQQTLICIVFHDKSFVTLIGYRLRRCDRVRRSSGEVHEPFPEKQDQSAHDAHVAEVAVVLVCGDIHMLVAVLGGFGSAYAVGGCLGEECHAVEADALAMEVIANRIVIGDGCAERIDAGILHVIDNGEVARTTSE